MSNEMLDIQIAVNVAVPDIRIGVERVEKSVSLGIDRGTPYHLPYTGDYFVIPALYDQQLLNTTNRLMLDDVLVDSIRITETNNPQGGRTVVIG